MGVSGNRSRIENIKYFSDGNLQDGSKKRNKAPKVKVRDDLKIILFLLMQQKEIKKNQSYYENKIFYITGKTLKNYNQLYNIDEIIQFTNNYYESKLSLNELNDWNKIVDDIIGYAKIYNEDSKNKKDLRSNSFSIEYFYSNNIKFPNNFSLIEEPFISKFNEIQEEKNLEQPQKKGYLIPVSSKKGQAKDNIIYILLNYDTKNNNDIYLGVSIEKYNFKVDFIFIVNQKFKTNDFVELARRKIEENKYLIKKKNVRKKINKDIEMICNPENIENKDYVNNREIYNKIFYYFSICKMYNEFISSFNDIKQYKLKGNEIDINHIQDIILNEKKLLNENLVYLVDEDIFKNQFLDGIIYYYQYSAINNSKNDEEKKVMIGNIFEDKNNNNNNDIEFEDLIKPLNYNDIIFNNNNKKISLISPELYQKILKKSEIDYTNINVNLIKINEEFYIYFNKIKKFVKLIKSGIKLSKKNDNKNKKNHDDNVWIVDLLNNEDMENKNKIAKDFNINENIIKKLFLYAKQKIEINNVIQDNKIKEMGNYNLINRKWLQKYKEHYKYIDVIQNLTDISFSGGDDFNEFKEYLDSVNKKNFVNDKINEKIGKFPDGLKNPKYVLPEIKKYFSYEFPNDPDIINRDLFKLLMDENLQDDSYHINVNLKHQNYRIYLGNQSLILLDEYRNILIFYSVELIDNTKMFKPKYLIEFGNPEILQEHIQIIKTIDNIDTYISQLGVDLKSDKLQIITIGKFLVIKIIELLTIESFTSPPLIGLENVGATCYMNATLQCFSNIDLLTSYFFFHQLDIMQSNKDYTLADEYLKVLLNLWNPNIDKNKRYYAPYDFKQRLGEKNPLFSGVSANDSKDLILFMLEEQHKDLNNISENNYINNDPSSNKSNNINYNENKNLNPIYDLMNNNNNALSINNQTEEIKIYYEFITDYNNQNNSIIKDIFYGLQESITICSNCKIKLYSFAIINLLIFPLEKVRQYLLQNSQNPFSYVTLENCFQYYTFPENLIGENQLYCNKCKNQYDAQTFNIIYKHPKVLIIILNRGQGLQFNVPFNYPKNFMLNNYINMNNNPNYKNVNKNIEYELISIITHMGESGQSGHFIACAKSPVDKNWYLYNDSIVTGCENPLNIFGSATTSSVPYVLFYQLIEDNNN